MRWILLRHAICDSFVKTGQQCIFFRPKSPSAVISKNFPIVKMDTFLPFSSLVLYKLKARDISCFILRWSNVAWATFERQEKALWPKYQSISIIRLPIDDRWNHLGKRHCWPMCGTILGIRMKSALNYLLLLPSSSWKLICCIRKIYGRRKSRVIDPYFSFSNPLPFVAIIKTSIQTLSGVAIALSFDKNVLISSFFFNSLRR